MRSLITRIKHLFFEDEAHGFFSPSILITILAVGLIIVLGIYLAIGQIRTYLADQDAKKPITLTVWGTRADSQVMDAVGQAYKKNHPNVTISYVQQSAQSYRTRTQTQISSQRGPDIVEFPNSWLPMFLQAKTIISAPASVFTAGQFGQLFYPTVSADLIRGGLVYGVPAETNGLVLYYNKDLLSAQGLSVPKTWEQFSQEATKTTVVDPISKAVTTAGAGMGLATNVDYWSDIIGLLLYQQPETSPVSPDNDKGHEAFTFYSGFANNDQTKVWDSNFDSTTAAFEQGKLTFYFAPLEKASMIEKANPNLHFATTPVPQLTDDLSNAVYWSRYLTYGVSSSSKNSLQAWQFLQFMVDPATQQLIFDQQKSVDGVGMPFARMDMAGIQKNDPILGAFVAQGPNYRSWYLNSDTNDEGLNDEMIKNFLPAVDGSGDVAGTAQNIPTILFKYGAYP